MNGLLRQALHRTRGDASNLYNRVHGSVPQLYVEQLYGVNEVTDTVPHSTDGGHPTFWRFAASTPLGQRPYDLEDPLQAFSLFFWIYGLIGLVLFANFLKYTSTWRHLFETLTFQYTYERELGEEYVWQWGGGVLHHEKATFIKNPLEQLGLVTELRTDMDYPDDY
jgi:hypothetical protein